MNATPIAPVVTSLTVARLHNLGNYEHVRYEVNVTVPDGFNPSAVLEDVTAILADLKPSPVSINQVIHARAILAEPEPPAVGDTGPYDQRQARERWETAGRLITRHNAEELRLARARCALNDLGGDKRYTDAKDEWEQEDEG